MKIITWNCQKKYAKNKDIIREQKPDIAIIPECEITKEKDGEIIWKNDNPMEAGIGIFSYSNYKIKVHPSYNPKFRYVVPIEVTGPNNFLLIAVWTKKKEGEPDRVYVEQFWQALLYYNNLLSRPLIIAGDFNWWINEETKSDDLFDMSIALLKEKGIESVYHYKHQNGKFGGEKNKTFFRKNGKKYHIDYCFASSDFLSKLNDVKVGKYSKWKKYSDHVPVIVTFSV
jgi:exonuclease III